MINKEKDKFIQLCKETEDYSKNGVKKHNKAMKELLLVFNEFEKNRDLALDFYRELLDNDDERVRDHAAAHCLRMEIHLDKAQSILANISETSSNPLTKFSAGMTLNAWKDKHI